MSQRHRRALNQERERPLVRPPCVRIALVGLHRRRSVWMFVWISLAIALACVAFGFVEPIFFIGGLMVFAALWYYLAIR